MTDILEETRASVAVLCNRMGRGEISEPEKAALRFAIDLIQHGELADALMGKSILGAVAEGA